MTRIAGLSRRNALQLATGAIAAPLVGLGSRSANAANPIQVLAWRYPASEFYASKLQGAVPGYTVNVQLMPSDKAMELATINLSSRSPNLDILMTTDYLVPQYVRNGWLRPVDDLWEKYKKEFDLADFPETISTGCTYKGERYIIPIEFNTPILFYRKDIFEEAGKQPPKTIAELQQLAKGFNTDKRSGVVMLLRVGDQCGTETHWYLSALGDGWYDDKWQPLFNSERGVKAIEAMKETSRYAQRGFATAAGDEGTLAMQQGFGTMGNIWCTRVSAVEDPKKSRFVGKFGYAVPPQGKQRLAVTGYAVSAFSQQDPDVLFRHLMKAITRDNMKQNVANNIPTRASLLSDAELAQQFPYLNVAKAAADVGTFLPRLPFFAPTEDIITRRILQALTGEMEVKAALDAAAGESKAYMASNGFTL